MGTSSSKNKINGYSQLEADNLLSATQKGGLSYTGEKTEGNKDTVTFSTLPSELESVTYVPEGINQPKPTFSQTLSSYVPNGRGYEAFKETRNEKLRHKNSYTFGVIFPTYLVCISALIWLYLEKYVKDEINDKLAELNGDAAPSDYKKTLDDTNFKMWVRGYIGITALQILYIGYSWFSGRVGEITRAQSYYILSFNLLRISIFALAMFNINKYKLCGQEITDITGWKYWGVFWIVIIIEVLAIIYLNANLSGAY